MDRKILFLIGLIVLIAQYANCSKLPAEDTDYKGDEDYLQDPKDESDYYDDVDDKKSTTASSSTDAAMEEYIRHEYTQTGDIGKNIVLTCKGVFDENTIFMWYNGSKIIAQGKQVFEKRVSISPKDGSLTIESVDVYDDGSYRCRAFPKRDRYETNVQLEINGPPKTIVISYNFQQQDNIDGKTLTQRAGEKDLRFKCNAGKSRPAAKFAWIHNGNAIQESKDNDIVIDSDLLNIKNLHARHAGEYQCEASNEYGEIKAKFTIDVQYPPFFTRGHSFFNTEIGSHSEIHCLYKSSPIAKSVKWFKGETQLHDSDKYLIQNDMKDHHERTKLLVKNVEKSDLGVYRCEVQNVLGMKKENITLDVIPAPPKFDGFKYLNNILFTDWIVKSHQELTSMQITYRNNEQAWLPLEAKITNQNEIKTGEWKIQGSVELQDGEWEIKSRIKNTEGWSDESHSAKIKTPKESTESLEVSANSASSLIMSSSMCGGLIAILITRYFV